MLLTLRQEHMLPLFFPVLGITDAHAVFPFPDQTITEKNDELVMVLNIFASLPHYCGTGLCIFIRFKKLAFPDEIELRLNCHPKGNP